MKKLLFAMLCIVSAFGMRAQTWTASEVGEGYFMLYNVGTGQYLTRGNGWGTQASITTTGTTGNGIALRLAGSGSDFKMFTGINGDAKGIEHLSGGSIYLDQANGKNSTWTFTKVATDNGPVYTIVSKDNHDGGAGAYLTAGANGTIVTPGTDGTIVRAHWKLMSIPAQPIGMASASESNPVDATSLIINANFSFDAIKKGDGWTMNSSNYNACGGNVTGANVIYNPCAESWRATFTLSQALTVPNGIYELTAQAVVTEYSVTGKNLPVVYANDATTPFTAMTNSENSMAAVANQFTAGNYTVGPIRVVVTNGSLTIGVRGTRTDTWCVWDNFRLTYKGIDLSALRDALQSQIDAVPALEGTTTTAAYNAAKTYADGINMDELTTEDAISTASTELSSRIDAAKALQANYIRYTNVKTTAQAISANVATANADSELAAATTNDAINAAIATLRAAFLAELPNLTIPQDPGYINVTSVMVDNAGVRQNTNYWTAVENGSARTGGSWAVCNYNECEFYNNNFKFYQTLALTPGTWEFAVTGFHRAGNHNTYFYAGEDKILIPGVESSMVNSMAQAQTYFDNGNGKVTLKFLVESAQDIEIGIDNQDTQTDKWTIFRDFTLKYYGAPDYSVYEQQWADAVWAANNATLTYPNVSGTELTNLEAAIADTPDGSGKANYLEKIQTLEAAVQAYNAAGPAYERYAAYKAETEEAWGTDFNVAAPTTAAEALVAVQNLNIAQYNKVTRDYSYSLNDWIGDFGSWTGTATVAGEDATPNFFSTQHWSGTTHAYYEQATAGWDNPNGWTIQYEKTCTLPAGDYVIKVAGRSSDGTTSLVSCSATSTTITLPNIGVTARGITTDGVASWSDNDSFANNNDGFGWQWRFLPFSLDEETEVTMIFYAEASTQYQWVSFADGELLSTNEIQEEEPSGWNDGNGIVYIQNVASGLWWGAGSTWGTQASLLPHPEYVKLIKNEDGTYKMESQVTMGGTQYYFDGDYMDTNSPVSLTITQESNYYTISSVSDEGDYSSYGFDGSTVLGKDVEEDTDEALWKIYTEEEMMSMMDNATIENPVDATFLILDPNFGRNNRNVGSWNMVASQQNLSGGNNVNNCAVSNHSTFTLSQTLNDIPNGIYAMKAQGFYRQYVADDVNLPVFYANKETAVFSTCISNESTMSGASESFTKGFYTIDPIFVEVTDGQLTVGARLENNTETWCVWDNFELYYYGSSVPSAYAVNLSYVVNEAMALETKLPNAAWQHLYAIVQQYNKEYETNEEYTNAIETIRTAIEESKRVGSVYAEYLSLIENAENIVNGLDISTDDYDIWWNALVAANEDVMDAESEEDIQELISQVRRATVDAIAASNITEPIDITSISLKNPDFEDGTINGWVCTFVSGETATNIGYQIGYQQTSPYTNGDVSIFRFIEAWQQSTTNKKAVGDGLLYQTVYGLPMGKYRLVTDAIAVDQYQNNNPVEGTYIYIQSGLLETKTEIATGNGLPEHFEVDFINDQADFLTFGLKTESTTANWIAADNFRIYFVEALTESPGVAALKEELTKYADIEFGPCNAEILAAFEEELEEATAMTTTDIYSAAHSAECIAEIDILQELYDAVCESESDYYYAQWEVDRIVYDEDMDYPVNVELKELKDQLQQILDEGTAIGLDFIGLEDRINAINEYWQNHLAEADIVSLRASLDEMDPIDEELGIISSWENRWNLDAEELSLDGVDIQGGRVLDIDLSNHGLKGQFPASLLGLTKLEWLDISNNELTGNIGAVGANCPNLDGLDASYNHFTSVVPALPATITNLYLDHQQLPTTWELDLSQMGSEDIVSQLPSILFYRHGYDPNTYLSVAAETESGWQTGIYYENGNITFYPADYTQPYKEENGAMLSLTCDAGQWYCNATGSTFSMKLYFAQGDANFTGDVDVLDLQTIIEYIFNEYYDIFNFTAANLYVDDRINVQDVVRMVDVLLEDEEEAGVKALAFRQRKANMEQPAQATLYWRGNELVLDTEVPVAAADIRIAGNGVKWNLQKSGFTVTEKNTGDRSRAIIYSLNGATIPVGENVIATRDSNDGADIVTAMLSTREATHIPVAISNQEETAIDRLIAADSAWTLTSVGGTTVAKGIGQSQLDETTRNLTKGIYILNTKQHTMKVTIK